TNTTASTFAPGNTIIYNVVVTNNGPSDVTGATVQDFAPAGVSGVHYSTNGAGSTAGDLNLTNVNLTATGTGATVTYAITGTLSQSASGTLVETATVIRPVATTDPDVS